MDNIIKVIFEEWQEVQHDNSLKQWSYGQVLKIEGLKLPEGNVEVHFSLTENNGNANVLIGTVENGVITVDIPRFILTKENVYLSSYNAYAWIYVDDGDTGQTIRKIVFEIESRPKPEDYVYTEDELKTYEALEKKVNAVEGKVVILEESQNKPKNIIRYNLREFFGTFYISDYFTKTLKSLELVTALVEEMLVPTNMVSLQLSIQRGNTILHPDVVLDEYAYTVGASYEKYVIDKIIVSNNQITGVLGVNITFYKLNEETDWDLTVTIYPLIDNFYLEKYDYVTNNELSTTLEDYVKNDTMASQKTPGLVKTYTAGGTGMDSQSRLVVLVASEDEIKNRTMYKKVITPSNMDLAVKEVLTNSQIEWTEDEKKAVRIMLGIEEEEPTTFICKCCGQEYSLDGEERQRYYDVDGNDVTEEVEASYGHYCTECIGGYAVEISCVNCGETDSIGNMQYSNGDWLCENCM